MPTLTINDVDHAYDEAGEGPALLLIHAGIADMRMWDDAWPALAARYRAIRFDLRGYGDTPLPDGPFVYAADAAELLRQLGVERAHVIGVSMGGGVALDLAVTHPALVDRLVLVGAGIKPWTFGTAMDAYDEAETEAVERGDLDEASWLNVRFWLDGPTRDEDAVDPALRRRVFEMQKHAFEADNEAADGAWLSPDRYERLGELTMPTLVLVGELDQPDFVAMARKLADEIPGARHEVLPGVAHLPPMEDPDGFVSVVGAFLDG